MLSFHALNLSNDAVEVRATITKSHTQLLSCNMGVWILIYYLLVFLCLIEYIYCEYLISIILHFYVDLSFELLLF